MQAIISYTHRTGEEEVTIQVDDDFDQYNYNSNPMDKMLKMREMYLEEINKKEEEE